MLDTFYERIRWRARRVMAWLFPLRGIEHDTALRRLLYLSIRKQNGTLRWWRRRRLRMVERI